MRWMVSKRHGIDMKYKGWVGMFQYLGTNEDGLKMVGMRLCV